MGSHTKNLQKRTKNLKILKKKLKKFDKFFKIFWKFSKSENRKFLKFFFNQKNCFPVTLRSNYIDPHRFLTQNRMKKFSIFWTEFFPKIRKILWAIFVGPGPTKCSHWETKVRLIYCPHSLSSTGQIEKTKKWVNL